MNVKRWTGFCSVFVVTMDGRSRKPRGQIGNEPTQGFFLLRRARVFGSEIGIEAADITHSYRIGIVPPAMRARLFDRTTLNHRPVKVDHIMIAYAGKSTPAMPPVNIAHAHIVPCRRG